MIQPPLYATHEALVRTKHDKKFNIIVYGLNECPKGTPRNIQQDSDLKSVVSVLSGLDNSIQSQSISDIFRLGKFHPAHKLPRPLMVKLIRVADVSSVLSKRGSLSHPVFIKPDLTKEERLRDSVLLKERWKLITPNHISKFAGLDYM